TLKAFADVAGHFGIFAATYGIALTLYSRPHTQVVVIGNDQRADELQRAAISPYSISKSVLRFDPDHVVAENLPPALAQTLPSLPAVKEKNSVAVLCSGFSCQPPVESVRELAASLDGETRKRRAS
ncbi:MAG TPA: thioredoxin domain-containing protein, partial [Terriglobales bacterium]|nr:thioredoxin domain-containing protein [Terriglobales bacterium]